MQCSIGLCVPRWFWEAGLGGARQSTPPIGFKWPAHLSFSFRAQSRAVQNTVDDINSRFGRGTIMYLSAEPIKM